jgi:hypothetical protein
MTNVSQPCPPDKSKRGLSRGGTAASITIYWNLLSEQADKFYGDLYENTGVPKEKIRPIDRNNGGCEAKGPQECRDRGWDFG